MAIRTPGSASSQTEALRELAAFPLVEALFGRRSRRFALGDELPDGPLAYRSRHQPLPLDELERLLVLSAMGGTTGWHYSITRHAPYALIPTTPRDAAAVAAWSLADLRWPGDQADDQDRRDRRNRRGELTNPGQ